jgi:ferredoxin
VFDESPVAGGILRGMEGLPPEVLDGEIEALRSAGITFELGAACAPLKAVSGFDGMVIAAQDYSGPVAENVLFAKDHRLVVMSVANGKAAAREMARLLEGRANDGTPGFDSRIGRLRESELQELTGNCPSAVSEYGDARREAARCLHCDCRKPVSCRLRQYAARYGADASEFPAGERDHVQLVGRTGAVVFEPGKCIKCGLCIEVARQYGEPLGLAFIGRGFNTRITVPFGEELGEGLQRAAKACVEICPTGALAFRDGDER